MPDDFDALPPEKKQEIKETGSAIVHMAQESTGGIIIGPPPSKHGYFATGSYFVLELEHQYWLGTANHVIEDFESHYKDDSDVRLHVGDLRATLEGRTVIRDQAADVALVSLARVELPLTKATPLSAVAGWPPPMVAVGNYVALCGYPAIIRERAGEREVEFRSLATIFRVTTVGERHCTCQFERDEWVTFNGPPPPKPGTELGGMSGGPVLLMRGLAFPLVGAISQFHSGFEILRVGLFRPPTFGDYPKDSTETNEP